jgi:signal transduction histidine kinase
MAVYFCCLEALQNAAKYSNASKVTVHLVDRGDALRFSVEDDGLGFDPAADASGTGLQNMADRLQALGGDLEIVSSPGQGTSLFGEVPVDPGARIPGRAEA